MRRRWSSVAASEANVRQRRTPLLLLIVENLRTAGQSRAVFRGVSHDLAWCRACLSPLVAYPAKRFVYIIRSANHPQRRYIGVTADVSTRLSAHNAGQNQSTAPWRPWVV